MVDKNAAPPRIISFAYKSFTFTDDGKKWKAECRTCKSMIVETHGTLGFPKMLADLVFAKCNKHLA